MNPDSTIPEFGIKRENEERRDGGCGVVFDPATQKYAVGSQDNGGVYRLFSGGVDAHEDLQEGILREVREESGLHDFLHVERMAQAFTHFYNNLKKVNRVALATCYLVILKSADLQPTQLEEHEKFTLAWATAEDILSNWESLNHEEDYSHWIYFFKKSVARAKELGHDTTSSADLL
jgi:ADP-ribose pyrophosphatase YjhB (NUDIX family)